MFLLRSIRGVPLLCLTLVLMDNSFNIISPLILKLTGRQLGPIIVVKQGLVLHPLTF